jgi:hypothetical protein
MSVPTASELSWNLPSPARLVLCKRVLAGTLIGLYCEACLTFICFLLILG